MYPPGIAQLVQQRKAIHGGGLCASGGCLAGWGSSYHRRGYARHRARIAPTLHLRRILPGGQLSAAQTRGSRPGTCDQQAFCRGAWRPHLGREPAWDRFTIHLRPAATRAMPTSPWIRPNQCPRRRFPARCILAVDPDPGVPELIERHLTAYDVIGTPDPARLDEQIALHRPRAVVFNRLPGTQYPAQQCEWRLVGADPPNARCPAEPGQRTILQVAACLDSPISAEQLDAELCRLGAPTDVLIIDDDRGLRAVGGENAASVRPRLSPVVGLTMALTVLKRCTRAVLTPCCWI